MPTTCVEQNRKLQNLQTAFADKGLHIVSITCDPGQDTPARLLEYSKRFNADPEQWHFLTDSDLEYIQKVSHDYFGLALEGQTHSDAFVLFNRDGTVREVYGVKRYLDMYDEIEKLYAEESDVATKEDGGESPTELSEETTEDNI